MKEHIRHLEIELRCMKDTHVARPALQAAIDIMRAAEPKDPAAEREHCVRVVNEIMDCDDWWSAPRARVVERERASVRAECAGKALEHGSEFGGMQLTGWRLRAQNAERALDRFQKAHAIQTLQLSAAREELAEATHFASYEVNRDLQSQLSAAQAEIERLHRILQGNLSDWSALRAEHTALETKLTNLRTAAGLYMLGSLSETAFYAAIEASR